MLVFKLEVELRSSVWLMLVSGRPRFSGEQSFEAYRGCAYALKLGSLNWPALARAASAKLYISSSEALSISVACCWGKVYCLEDLSDSNELSFRSGG